MSLDGCTDHAPCWRLRGGPRARGPQATAFRPSRARHRARVIVFTSRRSRGGPPSAAAIPWPRLPRLLDVLPGEPPVIGGEGHALGIAVRQGQLEVVEVDCLRDV